MITVIQGRRPEVKGHAGSFSDSEIMAVKSEDNGDLPLEPFQPKHIAFPSRSFRKSVNYSLQTIHIFASLIPRPSARGLGMRL